MNSIQMLGRHKPNRLVNGIVANLAALGSQVVVQLLSVPVLTTAYGVKGFGIWLLLATVPTYLLMSDLGLTTAAGNEIAIKWARHDDEGVLATFQSVGVGVAAFGAAIVAVVCLLVFVTSGIAGVWPADLRPHIAVIPLLTAYAIMVLVSFVAVAALRGTGYFARGTLLQEATAFAEGVGMMTAASLTHDMTIAAATMLTIRLLTTPLIYFEMRRLRPSIRAGFSHASRQEIRRLLPSALGALTIPGSLAISLQGTTLIVGAILGPAAVAVFASVRTASRFAVQITSMVVRAIVPELAAAHGRGDAASERRYWAMFNRLRWLMLIPAGIGFAVFGAWVVEVWSRGQFHPSFALVLVMALGILAHGSWFLDLFMLSATHRHVNLALPILVGCVLGLPVTVLATKIGGLVAAALSVLLLDLALAALVRLSVSRQTARPGEANSLPDNPSAA